MLSDSLEFARSLISLGAVESFDNKGLYYEPAYQLGLDMLKMLKSFDEIVVALLNEGLVMRALDFAEDH